jgi:hypothetical protein
VGEEGEPEEGEQRGESFELHGVARRELSVAQGEAKGEG